MDNYINEHINELVINRYKVDKYNIYHVYFFDDGNGETFRYFLSGEEFQKWCYDELGLIIIDCNEKETVKILNENKLKFNFTLDLESLYPK